MATVSFLWHLHQPAYRTDDGISHAPWAALHAGGAYLTLARAIERSGGRGQVVNIVPTLLEQLVAYRDGTVVDPVVEAVLTPVAELSNEQRELLVEWGFHVNPRQFARYPRLAELARRRPASGSANRLASRFGPGDLRDLQILFVLAQAGEQAWTDDRLVGLYERGTHFGADDHRQLAAWLSAQPGELVELWRRLAALPGVEIATSPYAHPIMPLLTNTAIVADSWAPHPPPRVPAFHHPEDAVWQLAAGLEFMRAQGFEPRGCWPPEGSVSEEVVGIYGAAGVDWLVTDEGILERSLDHPLREGERTLPELYRPWHLAAGGPTLYFRDRHLSDAIGFQYGRWDDEGRAAEALVRELEAIATDLPPEARIVVALDGENPWLHYPEGGGIFLRELMDRLNRCGPELVPATLDEATAGSEPVELPRLHPGSWINSVFATWIGHPEKTRAWEVLSEVREAIERAGGERPPSLLLAEGSDWFWWLGDDNPTELAPLYDHIFRRHLADACSQAGIESPVDLGHRLKTLARPLRVPVSESWPPPILDGRVTTYFEWSLAAWVEGPNDGPLRRMAVWGGGGRLYLLVEGAGSLQQLVDGGRLKVRLLAPDGAETAVSIGAADSRPSDTDWALGKAAELSLPWNGGHGWRLEVRLGEWQLPAGAALLLEPFPVDEEPTELRRKE